MSMQDPAERVFRAPSALADRHAPPSDRPLLLLAALSALLLLWGFQVMNHRTALPAPRAVGAVTLPREEAVREVPSPAAGQTPVVAASD